MRTLHAGTANFAPEDGGAQRLLFVLTFRNRKAREPLEHAPNLRPFYRDRGITIADLRAELASDAPFAGLARDEQTVVLKRIDFRPWHQEKHKQAARKEVLMLSKVKHETAHIIRKYSIAQMTTAETSSRHTARPRRSNMPQNHFYICPDLQESFPT